MPAHSLLTRRQALLALGGATSVVTLGVRAPRLARALACAPTPAETEGPFFVDELLERADITTDPSTGAARPGVPLKLRIVVVRADASCAPAAGVQVDVWHADAGGTYSDESSNGTAGRKFLRGYQRTDASGAVEFTTIHPGWYPGRTIHVHFKVRAFDGGRAVYDFTSQLYFDDALNDAVMAQAPYAGRGTRDTRNADDGIFDDSGALVVALTADGTGYAGTFTAALDGLPATTAAPACGDLRACHAAVTAALPDPAATTSAAGRRTARRLTRLDARLATSLDSAASASGPRRTRRYRRARTTLAAMRGIARAADAHAALGVPLAALEQAIVALSSAIAEVRA